VPRARQAIARACCSVLSSFAVCCTWSERRWLRQRSLPPLDRAAQPSSSSRAWRIGAARGQACPESSKTCRQRRASVLALQGGQESTVIELCSAWIMARPPQSRPSFDASCSSVHTGPVWMGRVHEARRWNLWLCPMRLGASSNLLSDAVP
jgi:hypothetical protein